MTWDRDAIIGGFAVGMCVFMVMGALCVAGNQAEHWKFACIEAHAKGYQLEQCEGAL